MTTAILITLGLLALLATIASPAFAQELRDVNLKLTLVLPNGAATTTSTAIDTGKTTPQGNQSGKDWLLSAPLLTTTEQPDAKTTIYNIKWSDNADLSSPTTYIAAAITQTGAGGAGSAAATFRFRLPSNAGRYVFFTAVGSATGNNSAKSATLEALV